MAVNGSDLYKDYWLNGPISVTGNINNCQISAAICGAYNLATLLRQLSTELKEREQENIVSPREDSRVRTPSTVVVTPFTAGASYSFTQSSAIDKIIDAITTNCYQTLAPNLQNNLAVGGSISLQRLNANNLKLALTILKHNFNLSMLTISDSVIDDDNMRLILHLGPRIKTLTLARNYYDAEAINFWTVLNSDKDLLGVNSTFKELERLNLDFGLIERDYDVQKFLWPLRSKSLTHLSVIGLREKTVLAKIIEEMLPLINVTHIRLGLLKQDFLEGSYILKHLAILPMVERIVLENCQLPLEALAYPKVQYSKGRQWLVKKWPQHKLEWENRPLLLSRALTMPERATEALVNHAPNPNLPLPLPRL